jgi:putative ABC transport system permease protein
MKFREHMTRLRFFVSRRANKQLRDIDEELKFHLEEASRFYVAAGKTDRDAWRQALIDFGAATYTREETYRQRPGWLLETLLQDIRYALRGFRRGPAFSLTVIATLALAIGATTAVFSVVDRILFRSLPYADADRLVSVGLTAPIIPQEFLLGGSYFVWRDNQKPFESLTSETGVEACDLTEHNPARLSCASVEGSFLPTLGISPILGRNFLPEEDRPNGPSVALISYSLWQSHYGLDSGILNRLITIDGHSVRVIGVLPKDFEMPALEAADVVRPQALDESEQRKADPGRVMYAFARLKPGITISQAKAQLQPVFNYSLSLAPAPFRKEVHLRVRSVRDRQIEDVRLMAWVLLGSVIAVLSIACANVTSLMMARGSSRNRELAVRAALGASRVRIVRQTMTEALLLSLAGAIAGCGLAEILLQIAVAIAPAGLPFLNKAQLDARIVLFAVMTALLCGILFGLGPALQTPRASALSARSMGSASNAALRRALVVGQIAVSMLLLSASMLLLRSFWNLQRQNLGLQSSGVASVSIALGTQHYDTREKQMQFFLRSEAALRRLPGVRAVGVSDSLPPGGEHHDQIYSVIEVPGRPRPVSGTGGMVAWRWVTPEYFKALDIHILEGRNFTEQDRTSSDHLLVMSQALAARLFVNEDPIGRSIRPTPNDPFYTVIGVATDVKNAGLSGVDEPEFYRLRRDVAEDWSQDSVLTVETSLAATAITPWIRSQIAQIDGTVPVEIESMSERVNKLADRPRFETALLSFFASTGLIMALIGIYGVTSFMAARRKPEIGVRMALGANRVDILRLILREGMSLLIMGGLLGLCGSLLLTQLLKSLLFNIGPRDPVTLTCVALLLAVVVLVAILIPARKAMRVDPCEALRCE